MPAQDAKEPTTADAESEASMADVDEVHAHARYDAATRRASDRRKAADR
jgi:hypothetical protein